MKIKIPIIVLERAVSKAKVLNRYKGLSYGGSDGTIIFEVTNNEMFIKLALPNNNSAILETFNEGGIYHDK